MTFPLVSREVLTVIIYSPFFTPHPSLFLTYLNSDVVLQLVAGVHEEGEEGEMDVVVRGVDAKGHLRPHDGDGEEGQTHRQDSVHPTPQPYLPVPLYS